MLKHGPWVFVGLLGFAVLLSACSPASEDQPPASDQAPALESASDGGANVVFAGKWTVSGDLQTPESAYYDSATGDVFVSLVAGVPNEKDGNGGIARIMADGTVKAPAWVTGLNAPKGLRSHQGTLWTADIDEIVEIEISSAHVMSKTKVPGAQFLNDVAVGPDGTVYVTDMMTSKIHALKDGKVSVFAEGEDLEYPNGILVDGDSLVVGGWGKPEADFSTKVPGRLYRLDLKTKAKTLITPDPAANIDGVESDGKGGYIISDWNAGAIYQVKADGKLERLSQFKQGTADIGIIPSQGLLIIPHMNDNMIGAYDISAIIN